MQTTNLTLAYLSEGLSKALKDAHLNKVQRVDKSLFKFKFHTKQGTKDLIASPAGLYITKYSLQGLEPKGFPEFVKKELSNKRVLSIEQHGFDRIIVFTFHTHRLIFELFADGNIILADKDMKILMPLRHQSWADRTVKRNHPYKFPAPRGESPAETTPKMLGQLLPEKGTDVVRALIKSLNIAPPLAEEACLLAKVEKDSPANKLKPKDFEKLAKAIKSLYTVSEKKLKPVVVSGTLLPFSLTAMEGRKEQAFESLDEALDENISLAYITKEETAAKGELSSETARIEHNLLEQEEAKAKFLEQEEKARKAAELIYSNYVELEELLTALKSAKTKKIPKEEIMYKLKNAAKSGDKAAKLFVDFDPKTNRLTVELN